MSVVECIPDVDQSRWSGSGFPLERACPDGDALMRSERHPGRRFILPHLADLAKLDLAQRRPRAASDTFRQSQDGFWQATSGLSGCLRHAPVTMAGRFCENMAARDNAAEGNVKPQSAAAQISAGKNICRARNGSRKPFASMNVFANGL